MAPKAFFLSNLAHLALNISFIMWCLYNHNNNNIDNNTIYQYDFAYDEKDENNQNKTYSSIYNFLGGTTKRTRGTFLTGLYNPYKNTSTPLEQSMNRSETPSDSSNTNESTDQNEENNEE